MADGTTYYVRVVVRDNAGNEGKSAADNGGTSAITPSANTNPWFTTQAYASSRGTNSMTISAVATDNEQSSLTYTLYWNGSSSATQTKTANKGTTVTFNTINGLSEYTTYSWRVVVADGAGGSATSSGDYRTYCSGTGLICNGPFVTEKNCTSCSGTGTSQHEIPDAVGQQTRNFFTDWSTYECFSCGKSETAMGGPGWWIYCKSCGGGGGQWLCSAHYKLLKTETDDQGHEHTTWVITGQLMHKGKCSSCGGSGKVVADINCSHGKNKNHQYCIHNYTTVH